MVTDRRSAKVAEIESNPAGEIAWYFTHSREQFRIRGELRLVGADPRDPSPRTELWDNLSNKAREQFFWPHPGKQIRSDDADTGAPAPTKSPPEDFLLLALSVSEVDHLSLRGEPQSRVQSRLDSQGRWTSQAVNP